MRKLLTIVLLAAAVNIVTAQEYTDEMKRIIGYALELRKPDSDKAVLEKMKKDVAWTFMDEIKIMNPDAECDFSRRFEMKRNLLMFGMNDLAYQVEEKTERIVTAGNFCNGTDPRYKYSFIERTILKDAVASYEIPQRKGEQIFLIIPFSLETMKLTAVISCGENIFPCVAKNDGILEMRPVVRNQADDKLILTVSNFSGQDASFLIVNYNSRSGVN